MIYMQRIMQALYGAVNETCKMIRYIQNYTYCFCSVL